MARKTRAKIVKEETAESSSAEEKAGPPPEDVSSAGGAEVEDPMMVENEDDAEARRAAIEAEREAHANGGAYDEAEEDDDVDLAWIWADPRTHPKEWGLAVQKAVEEKDHCLLATCWNQLVKAGSRKAEDKQVGCVKRACAGLVVLWKKESEEANAARLEAKSEDEPIWIGGYPIPMEIFVNIISYAEHKSSIVSSSISKGWYTSTYNLPGWKYINFNHGTIGRQMGWSDAVKELKLIQLKNPVRKISAVTFGNCAKLGKFKALGSACPNLQWMDVTHSRCGMSMTVDYQDLAAGIPTLRGLSTHRVEWHTNSPDIDALEVSKHLPNLESLSYNFHSSGSTFKAGASSLTITRLSALKQLKKLSVSGAMEGVCGRPSSVTYLDNAVADGLGSLPCLTDLVLVRFAVSSAGWDRFVDARKKAEFPPMKSITIVLVEKDAAGGSEHGARAFGIPSARARAAWHAEGTKVTLCMPFREKVVAPRDKTDGEEEDGEPIVHESLGDWPDEDRKELSSLLCDIALQRNIKLPENEALRKLVVTQALTGSRDGSGGNFKPDVALNKLKSRWGLKAAKPVKAKVEEGGSAVPVAKVEAKEEAVSSAKLEITEAPAAGHSLPAVKSEETIVKKEHVVKEESVDEEEEDMMDVPKAKEEVQEFKAKSEPALVKWIITEIFDEDGVKLEWGSSCGGLLHIQHGYTCSEGSYWTSSYNQPCEWLKIDDEDVVQQKSK